PLEQRRSLSESWAASGHQLNLAVKDMEGVTAVSEEGGGGGSSCRHTAALTTD
ncbi:hypothetical protein J6590_024815, partial [Homalodisca vitripennis]